MIKYGIQWQFFIFIIDFDRKFPYKYLLMQNLYRQVIRYIFGSSQIVPLTVSLFKSMYQFRFRHFQIAILFAPYKFISISTTVKSNDVHLSMFVSDTKWQQQWIWQFDHIHIHSLILTVTPQTNMADQQKKT